MPGGTKFLGGLTGETQRPFEIGDQIVRMFEPNGKTEQRLRRARVWAFDRLSMLDQAFHAAEAGGARENPGVVRHRHGRRTIAFDFEGNHPAKQLHLSLGEAVLWMCGEARIMHPLDTSVSIQKRRHPLRVFAMRAHPAGQRLNSAMHQPAIKRSGHGPADRLDLAQALEKFVIPLRDQCAAEHVAMAAKIFRGRMQDQIRAEPEWSLNDGRPCVVANQKRPGPMRNLGHGRDVGQSSRRVGRGLNPDEFCLPADRLFDRTRSVRSTKSTASCQRPKMLPKRRRTPWYASSGAIT